MNEPAGHRSQGGYALLVVLIAIAVLAPLAAFAVMQAQLDALIAQQTRWAVEAFRVAESGLEHALADLAADPRFERLGVGPDGRAGTGDDGDYPFAQAPPPFFPRPPFRYQVRVQPAATDRVDLVAWGFGSGATAHAVGASVVRDGTPYVPAALAATAASVDLLLGPGLRIVGDVGAAGIAALAVGSDATAARLRSQLDPQAGQLVGADGPPSIAARALPDLAEVMESALRRADARLVGGELQGDIGHGLFVSPGALRLTDIRGDGVLVAGGRLDLDGAGTFSGLVVALGGLAIDDGATATLRGAVLAGGALLLRGGGELRYDRQVIEGVGREFGGLLPHRLRVAGWREWPEAVP